MVPFSIIFVGEFCVTIYTSPVDRFIYPKIISAFSAASRSLASRSGFVVSVSSACSQKHTIEEDVKKILMDCIVFVRKNVNLLQVFVRIFV